MDDHTHDDEDRLHRDCPACRQRVVDDQINAAVADGPVRLIWVMYEALGREYDFSLRLPWPDGHRHEDLFRYWTGLPLHIKVTPPVQARQPLWDAILAHLRKHEAGTILDRCIDDIHIRFLEVDVSVPPEKTTPTEIEGQGSLFD